MNIAVLGAGVMGRLTERVAAESGIGVAGVVEPLEGGRLENLGQKPHVIIDFSHPDNTDALCGFCAERGVKAVIGCTGHSAEQKERIRKLAESCGVVMSANFSYGLNVLLNLAGQAAALLGDGFDTELCETHHRRKTDAPSGTALALLEVLKGVGGGGKEAVFDRRGRGQRRENEIGVSVLRGGGVCGRHEVMFLGEAETLTLCHTALDRSVFARGALTAAQWLCDGDKKGFFTMSDVLKGGERYD